MDVFFWRLGGARLGWCHPPILTPHTDEAAGAAPSHTRRTPTPHLAHTAEDALEGVYFGDRRILRCLPYFCEKTRPRGSYELLEAFSSSCGECGVASASGGHHPTLLTPRHHHLSPHRRGCPRRGLFRVFVHPKVFALLFA